MYREYVLRIGDGGGDSAIRPLSWDKGAEEFRGGEIVGPRPKVWTRDQNERNSAKDGATERLRCGTIQEEVS